MNLFAAPIRAAASAFVLAALFVGCATTGGSRDQVSNTIFATHKSVRNIEQSLGSVEQLNNTAAQLSARMEETERQTRALQGTLEENQVKLRDVEKKLDALTATLYKVLNLSPPSTQSRVSPSTPPGVYVPEGGVKIDQPAVEPSAEGVPAGQAAEPGKVTEPEPELAPNAPSAPDTAAETRPEPAEPKPEAAPAAEADASAVDLYRNAQSAYSAKKYDQALEQFTEYLDKHADTNLADNAQFWKAECELKLGQYEQAVVEYEKLRQAYPSSEKAPFSMYNQAAAHLRLNQNEKAKALLEDLVENYPMTAPAEQAAPALKKLQQQTN